MTTLVVTAREARASVALDGCTQSMPMADIAGGLLRRHGAGEAARIYFLLYGRTRTEAR